MENNGKFSFEKLKSNLSHEANRLLLPLSITAITSASLVSLMALEFSEKTRREIKERSKFASELDPRFKSTVFLLQCAHKEHDRRKENYNSPDNGYLTTVWQHHNGLVGDIRTVNPKFKGEDSGLVDHSMFANEGLSYHFTKEAIAKFVDRYGSNIRLWKYLPPQWDFDGKAIGDELGFIARPATWQEREDGICRIEIPLMLNKQERPTERQRVITFKNIQEGKAKPFSKLI